MNKLYFGDNLVILKEHITVSAGFYQSPIGKSYPKIQILTIEGLLNKTQRPEFPDLTMGSLTFKKAQKEKKHSGQEKLL